MSRYSPRVRRNKFSNIKTRVDGHLFDSKREAARYQELKLLALAGEIADLEIQPPYDLHVNGTKVARYIADFRYEDRATGATVVEDAKGMRTRIYRLKAKMLKAEYGIDIQEV